jgi:hypothetical protein
VEIVAATNREAETWIDEAGLQPVQTQSLQLSVVQDVKVPLGSTSSQPVLNEEHVAVPTQAPAVAMLFAMHFQQVSAAPRSSDTGQPAGLSEYPFLQLLAAMAKPATESNVIKMKSLDIMNRGR